MNVYKGRLLKKSSNKKLKLVLSILVTGWLSNIILIPVLHNSRSTTLRKAKRVCQARTAQSARNRAVLRRCKERPLQAKAPKNQGAHPVQACVLLANQCSLDLRRFCEVEKRNRGVLHWITSLVSQTSVVKCGQSASVGVCSTGPSVRPLATASRTNSAQCKAMLLQIVALSAGRLKPSEKASSSVWTILVSCTSKMH